MSRSRRALLNKRRALIFILAAIGVFILWPAPASLRHIAPSSTSSQNENKNDKNKQQTSPLADGEKFFEESRIKGTNRPDSSYSPSVLFISFHEGTAVDFHGVAQKLNFTYAWTYPRSQYFQLIIEDPYKVSEENANLIWTNSAADTCKNYDVIVVADTVPAGGRTYIQGLLHALREARESSSKKTNNNNNDEKLKKSNKTAKEDILRTNPSNSNNNDNKNENLSPQTLLQEFGYKAKVVLLLTQRFDYNTFNDTAYHNAFKDAINEGVVEVVANNPFEEWYMKAREGIQFENRQDISSLSDSQNGLGSSSLASPSSSSWLWQWLTSSSSSSASSTTRTATRNKILEKKESDILSFEPTIPIVRPHGRGWDVWPSQDLAIRDATLIKNDKSKNKDPKYALPALINTRNRQDPLLELLNDSNIEYTLLKGGTYGGPHGLSLYKCFIHSPYQVSTMSLYENLAAGVVIFVPTVELLKKFGSFREEFYLPEEFPVDDIPWELVEWYSPYFDDVIIKFSSAEHLIKLLKSTNFDKARQRAVQFMDENEKLVLQQWKEIIFN